MCSRRCGPVNLSPSMITAKKMCDRVPISRSPLRLKMFAANRWRSMRGSRRTSQLRRVTSCQREGSRLVYSVSASSKVRFECVGTTDSMMCRNVRFPSAGLVGSNVSVWSVSSVVIGVADELCDERIAASQDAVAECSVTEVIGTV